MKKLLFILSLSFSSALFAQERNGITYQALIVDPSGEFLPGADNNYSPLKNTSVCLQFHIIDSTNSYEYSEQHTVTTDNFGMVNLVIGTGSAIGGLGWENVSWSASAKSLKVDVDKTGSCSSFEELSNQPLTSVPFALYSPGSDTPGPKGDPGEEGMSAYEVWLGLGNTGTEQDFIDSLKGLDGEPGQDGNNFFDEMVPSTVIILSTEDSFTIPDGYIGKITGSLLRYNDRFKGPAAAIGSGGAVVSINGINYIMEMTTLDSGDYNFSVVQGDFWVPSNTQISVPLQITANTTFSNDLGKLFINLYENTTIKPILIDSESIIPDNKIWKLSTLFLESNLVYENNVDAFIGTIFVDNFEHLVLKMGSTSTAQDAERLLLTKNNYWFGQQTNISPGKNIGIMSFLEFDNLNTN